MSAYPRRDGKVGAGAWLLFGAVAVGVFAATVAAASAVHNLAIVKAPGARVRLPGGTTPANLAKLQAAAPGAVVSALPDGTFLVATAADLTLSVPGGVSVV